MNFNLSHSRPFQIGLVALAGAGAAFMPDDADAQQQSASARALAELDAHKAPEKPYTSYNRQPTEDETRAAHAQATADTDPGETYREYAARVREADNARAERAKRATVTYYDEDQKREVTVLLSEMPEARARGPVPNDDFHMQVTLQTEAGVPLTNAFSDGRGSFTRLTLDPEVQAYFLAASASFNVAQFQVGLGDLEGNGWGHFDIDALRQVDFRANIIGGDTAPVGALWNALVPRAIEPDNDLRIAATLRMLPGDKHEDGTHEAPAWLPGISTAFTLVPHGPLGSIVSLEASTHLDPALFREGTYLPKLGEAALQLGWYGGKTTDSVQVDFVLEAGIRAEVVQQAPEAPLHSLDERVSSEIHLSAGATLRLGAPESKKPQR